MSVRVQQGLYTLWFSELLALSYQCVKERQSIREHGQRSLERLLRACFTGLYLYVTVIYGGYSDGVPPLPIPNRAVKPVRADDTAHKAGK